MRVKLGECVKQIRGVSYKPTDLHDRLDDYSVPLLRANNIQNGRVMFDDLVYVSKEKVHNQQYLKKGDILICTSSGSKELVGKAAFIEEDLRITFGAFCKVARPINGDAKYISYFFQSPQYRHDIFNLASGANINNIRNEHIENLWLPFPHLDEQRRIAAVLDKVTDLIAKRQAQLDKLDLLVKSRFVEMFGEPGANQKGWNMACLGSVCAINPKKAQDKRLTNGLRVSFVPMSAVSEDGEIDVSETKIYNDVKTGFTYFAENDVLFAKITPCMENGKGAIAQELCNGIGFGSTEFHVLRPLSGISNPYWIYTLTSFQQFRKDAASNMTGSAGQRRVPASFLETYKVSVPPIELQNQFASFAERTKHIKIETQHTVDKLNVLKESLMQKYFTAQ